MLAILCPVDTYSVGLVCSLSKTLQRVKKVSRWVGKVPRHCGHYVAIMCWPKNLHSDIAPDEKGFTMGGQLHGLESSKGSKAPCRHQKNHKFFDSDIAPSQSEGVFTVSPNGRRAKFMSTKKCQQGTISLTYISHNFTIVRQCPL